MSWFIRTIGILGCFVFFACEAASADNPFIGRWYTKPVFDDKLYGQEIFAQMELKSNGSIAYRIFGILQTEQGKKVAGVFLEVLGTWEVVDNSIVGVLPDGDVKLRFEKIEDKSMRVEETADGKAAFTDFLNEQNAPWSQMIKTQ